ncbi:MAG TPA: DNA repair protein RadC [Caulobacteraceae bacterium]|jgi:DNA repair protein RadC|nr:DNA repair protein RadC [Caulobacteraceae bacterium]
MLEDAGLFGTLLDFRPRNEVALPLPPPAAPAKPSARGRPHTLGHRSRLRDRAALGFTPLPDYELVELLLARSLPRGDIKPIAKALLARFGGLGEMLGASLEELKAVKGVGPAAALDLKLVHEAAVRMGRAKAARRPVISSWSALLAYVRVAMAGASREQFRVLFLDKKNQLIGDEVMNEGTVDHAPVYPREVMRRALELGASAIILAHNHPSGDPTPSAADVAMTKQVAEAGKIMGVAVHDHIVVGREGVASLKALGLF